MKPFDLPIVSGVTEKVCEWAGALEKRRQQRAEIEAMDPEERARLAGDIGMSAEELVSMEGTAHGPRDLMPERLKALGLPPDQLRAMEPAVYRDMQRVCSHCQAMKKCEKDMAHGDYDTGHRDYCLNAPTIDALDRK